MITAKESIGTMAQWKAKGKQPPNGHRRPPGSQWATTYTAIPPEDGWPGGAPERNGWRPGGKR